MSPVGTGHHRGDVLVEERCSELVCFKAMLRFRWVVILYVKTAEYFDWTKWSCVAFRNVGKLYLKQKYQNTFFSEIWKWTLVLPTEWFLSPPQHLSWSSSKSKYQGNETIGAWLQWTGQCFSIWWGTDLLQNCQLTFFFPLAMLDLARSWWFWPTNSQFGM